MSTNTNIKTRGGFYHVLSQLTIKNIITADDQEHLKREYNYGRINGFRHLAEYLLAFGTIKQHNYDQIVGYGRKFGEN